MKRHETAVGDKSSLTPVGYVTANVHQWGGGGQAGSLVFPKCVRAHLSAAHIYTFIHVSAAEPWCMQESCTCVFLLKYLHIYEGM